MSNLTPDDFDQDYPDDCPNCGGEGVIYMCVDDGGCVDAEGGCDLCERRCDWCKPSQPPAPRAEGGQ